VRTVENLSIHVALLAVLIGAVSCGPHGDLTIERPTNEPANSEWLSVKSSSGRFKALMPGRPTVRTNVYQVNGITTTEYEWTIEIEKAVAYSVRCFELPNKNLRADEILDSIRTQLAKTGTIVSENAISYQELPAREFVVDINHFRCTTRVFLVRPRVCTAVVAMPAQFFISPKNTNTTERAQKLMNRFFDSVEFK
jgi:hypothetical protein